MDMPAISLAALPGRRKAIIKLAQEAEARGFAGIYLPSLGDNMSLATAGKCNPNHHIRHCHRPDLLSRATRPCAGSPSSTNCQTGDSALALASPTPRPMRATACRSANRSPIRDNSSKPFERRSASVSCRLSS